MKYLISTLLWFLFCSLTWATLTIDVEPTKIQLDETCRLTITQDDPGAAGLPDLTPLEPYFTIVGTEHSVSYTVINGQARSVNQWGVLLRAKQTGILPIPAIQMGPARSVPSQVTVTSNNTTPSTTSDKHASVSMDDEVILTTSVNPDKPLLNEQVTYTVTLLNRERLVNADYQPPRVEDALIIPLGEGSHMQRQQKGQTYGVEEQQYAVFPQKSGTIPIIGPTFNALVYRDRPRPIHRKGADIQLNVQPMPAQSKSGEWLPAKRVTLTEQYDTPESTINQGNTLVRTITLQAEAMPAQLLPVLRFPNSDQYNAYPEKPETHNRISAHTLTGSTTVKVTYLLHKSGAIMLPALQVPWFNTLTRTPEIASLPARLITVKARMGNVPKTTTTVLKQKPTAIKSPIQRSVFKISVLLGAGTLALLSLLLAWWFHHRPRKTKTHHAYDHKQLRRACLSNDPIQTKQALMQWASMQWPHARFLNLKDIEPWINDTKLQKQLHRLSHALYSSDQTTHWQGIRLWRSFKACRPVKTNDKTKHKALPPLNRL